MSKEEEEIKSQSSINSKRPPLTQTNIVNMIIEQISDDIVQALKGKNQKTINAGDGQLVFFESNTKNIPPGTIESIEGKNQKEPMYVSMSQITTTYLAEDERVGFTRHKSKNKDNTVIGPSEHLSDEVHPLIFKLMGKNEEEILNVTSFDSQAIKLAQLMPSTHNPAFTIWDEFVGNLLEEIKFEIWENQQSSKPRGSVKPKHQASFNQFRSQDTKNFRVSMSVIQKYI